MTMRRRKGGPIFLAGNGDDASTIVLNQQARSLLGRPALDTPLLMAVEGRTVLAMPGGNARQILTPATT